MSILTQRAAGVNVWAAANGGMFEAKSLFDGAGYESDIYSGVLGVDYQFACNAVFGRRSDDRDGRHGQQELHG